MANKHIMSIDPSINSMGVAVFNKKTKKLIYYKLHKPEDRKGTEFDKSLSLYYQVRALRKKYQTIKTIMEIPVHWERDGFVARESGSIQKMMIIIGMIYTFGDVLTVPPHGWKKQMPKKVVQRRLMLKYDEITMAMDHNIVDAIGIGHWHLYGKV